MALSSCDLLDPVLCGACSDFTSDKLPKACYTFHLMAHQKADHRLADSLLLEHVANVNVDDGDLYCSSVAMYYSVLRRDASVHSTCVLSGYSSVTELIVYHSTCELWCVPNCTKPITCISVTP